MVFGWFKMIDVVNFQWYCMFVYLDGIQESDAKAYTVYVQYTYIMFLEELDW